MVRVIAIILLLYFGIRLLGRLFAPSRKPGNQGRASHRDEVRPEGDVRIEYTDRKQQRHPRKDTQEGEYVDFEELD